MSFGLRLDREQEKISSFAWSRSCPCLLKANLRTAEPTPEMNKLQKIILSLYAAVISVMCLVPPWEVHYKTEIFNMGYHPIWSRISNETFNVQMLGIQILAATLITGALWLVAKDSKPAS